MDAAPPPLLALADIDFAYPGQPELFRGLCFSWREGERVGVEGPNGSGKTTLLRLLMGLEQPSAGTLCHRGETVGRDQRALRRLRLGIGYVAQNSEDQLFSVTVWEDVAFGPLNLGLKRKEARARAMEALAELGVEHLADRATDSLSGGEKKLVAIATVWSMRPGALVLDEPTALLDDASAMRVRELLARDARARVVVSHDPAFLDQAAPDRRVNLGAVQN